MVKNIVLLQTLLVIFVFTQNSYAQNAVKYTNYHKKKQDKVYKMTEVAPKPVVGLEEFYENTKYHIIKALKASGQEELGAVYVRFIVEKNGSLSDIHVVKGIGGCDTEVVQCFKYSKWKPGIQAGKAVRVQKTVCIRLN